MKINFEVLGKASYCSGKDKHFKSKLKRAKFIFFVIVGANAIPAIITSAVSGSGFLVKLTIHFADSIAHTFDMTAFQFLFDTDTFLIIIAVT